MNENHLQAIALLRLAVLGDLIHAIPGSGEQRRLLFERAMRTWTLLNGSSRQYSRRTIEAWLYAYRRDGFNGLMPSERRDKGSTRALTDSVQELILAMKREDPGRSVPLIIRELEGNGVVSRGELKPTVLRRLLRAKGLSGPQMKVAAVERHRFVAASCNGLWQGDACHGPKIFDPAQGRAVRAKIFGLLDDKSRLVTHLLASFSERQEDFLRLLHDSVRRRGVPRAILLDNQGSFTGSDVRITCAQLGIRLVFARPRDGQSKGKVERFWRTLRSHVLDRLQPGAVETLDDLNLRLSTWVHSDYNVRPHAGVSGRTPLSVFEEDAAQGDISFLADHAELEANFVAHIERTVQADSTCSVGGVAYEVPQHFRGRKVTLYYAVLRPGIYWIEEGGVRVPVAKVDAEANFSRRRKAPIDPALDEPWPSTGMNAVEDMIRQRHHPTKIKPEERVVAEEEDCEGDDDVQPQGASL
jgi:putative transposase